MHLYDPAPGSLVRIPSDFSPAKKAAIAGAPQYLHSVKLAFEAPRFWEADDNIFGGLAWTDRLNENVMYPSAAIGSAKGIIIGAYCAGRTHNDTPDLFAALTHEERFRDEPANPSKRSILYVPDC